MNEDYDTIALGTGLKECIVTGLLATTRKEKILQMDRNSYYGGESASLNLEQLYHRFHGPEAKVPESFGRMRDYNIDLCPKFIMACGNLVKVLLASQCVKYLEFRSVSGSFVYKDGEIFKVPATGGEAMMSNLMGFMQKRRFRNFVTYANKYSQSDEKTWEGIDASKTSSAKVFEHFSLDENTISFTGHALALYQDDEYLKRPALECFDRCNLYAYSLSRYGNSPFIYPLWGLGGLPEGFSRVCAVHGGVYMLNKPVEEILYDENGHVTGVRSEGEVARCKKLIADPSYFIGTDKVRKVGQVARCICILSHPIPNTNDADSCQIIIPGRQIPGRRSDIYMSCTSYHHKVAATGRYIVVISANVETADAHRELIPALALLGKIDKEFFWVSDQYEPTTDGSKDGIFITKSYDATSHFETSTNEVLALFKAMTGVEADLTASPEEVEEAE